MKNVTHLNVAIISDTDLKEEDYVFAMYDGIKKVDEKAEAVIGTVFMDNFRSGMEGAIMLMESYRRNKDGLTNDDIDKYIAQLKTY